MFPKCALANKQLKGGGRELDYMMILSISAGTMQGDNVSFIFLPLPLFVIVLHKL